MCCGAARGSSTFWPYLVLQPTFVFSMNREFFSIPSDQRKESFKSCFSQGIFLVGRIMLSHSGAAVDEDPSGWTSGGEG